MRRLPGSKHYVCRQCGYAYLLVFNRWLLKRGPHSHQSAGSRGA
jgi:hypothetical protein